MSDDCKFSVVIPTYNRARFLGRALDSVLAQTQPAAQIIVVDDGSTDNTEEVCRRYTGVQYERQSNAGASAARNVGVRLAREAWVAFLDSDDYWAPRHLENMKAAIAKTRGEAVLYFSDMQMTAGHGGGTLWKLSGFNPPAPFYFTADATGWMLMKRQPMMLQCSVINRVALERSGLFDPRFRVAEDTDLFCRLGIGGSACAVSGAGCVQTSDDNVQNRLSQGNEGRAEPYGLNYLMLWCGVYHRFPTLADRYRRLVRYNYAGSCLGMAKLRWRSSHILSAVGYLARSLWVDPRLGAWILRHGTSRGYEQTVRN